jgi:hypothetical protein
MVEERKRASKRAPFTPAAAAAVHEAIRREIELRAYYRYCERGRQQGGELEDWVMAEQEIVAAPLVDRTGRVEGSADAQDRPRRGRRPAAR